MTSTDLAARAAWFHGGYHHLADVMARASEDREAWLAYVDWHKATARPDRLTPEQCQLAIAERLARQ